MAEDTIESILSLAQIQYPTEDVRSLQRTIVQIKQLLEDYEYYNRIGELGGARGDPGPQGPPGSAGYFLDLADTPNSYAGDALKALIVTSAENGVEFGNIQWDDITGVPGTFPPDPHTHPWDDITGKPATYPPDPHTHLEADITDLDRLRPRKTYVEGTAYLLNDYVREGAYTGAANKDNPEGGPAPINNGAASFDLPDTPTWDVPTPSFLGTVVSGQKYTLNTGGYAKTLDIWVPDVSTDIKYRIVTLDITDPNTPISNYLIDPVLEAGEWSTVVVGNELYLPGTVLAVVVDAFNSGQGIEFTGGWTAGEDKNDPDDAPDVGGWNRDKHEMFNFSRTDLDATDRLSELMSVIPGSTIQIVQTSDTNKSWTMDVLQEPTSYPIGATGAAITHVSYECNRIINEGNPAKNQPTTCTFNVPTPVSTKYVEWTNGSALNQPTWASVEGYLALNGDEQIGQPLLNSYGTRLEFQPAYVSPDWDLYSISGGSGGSGGDGGGGVTTFTALTDTPASYAGQAGKLVSVNGTGDGLEFTVGGAVTGGADVGQYAYFATENPPNQTWEVADGGLLSRAAYPEFFAAVGTMYGAGDGSTTFAKPNISGEFLRSLDGGAGVDPDAGARTDRGDGVTGDAVGTRQADDTKSHDHSVDAVTLAMAAMGNHHHLGDGGKVFLTGDAGVTYRESQTSTAGDGISGYLGLVNLHSDDRTETASAGTPTGTAPAHDTNVTGGSETRPTNVYGLLCVKVKPSPTGDGAYDFIDLLDTPVTYAGEAGKFTQVNVDEDALEFADVDYSDLTGVPADFPPSAHTHVEADITDLDRTRWRGNWIQQEYPKNDEVLDGEYLMQSNKTTSDRPAPQKVGEEKYVYQGASPTTTVTAKTLLTTMIYTLPVALFVTRYRVYTVIGNLYSITLQRTLTGQVEQLMTFTATSTGWQDFNTAQNLIPANTQFKLGLYTTEPDPSPSTFVGDWDYNTPNNASTPAAGDISHANKLLDSFRINKTDDNGGDRSAELEALTTGDLIEGLGMSWSIQATTDNGTWMDFSVAPAQQASPDGVTEFTFETVVSTPITIVRDINYYSTDIAVSSEYQIDGGLVQPSQDAFGVDIQYQEATISADWDLKSTLGSSGSGGSGGGGASTFTELSDTPASYAGEGGKAVVVKADGTGLEFVEGVAGDWDVFHDPTGVQSYEINKVTKTLRCWGRMDPGSSTSVQYITYLKVFAQPPAVTLTPESSSGKNTNASVLGDATPQESTRFGVASQVVSSGTAGSYPVQWHAIGEWDGN